MARQYEENLDRAVPRKVREEVISEGLYGAK